MLSSYAQAARIDATHFQAWLMAYQNGRAVPTLVKNAMAEMQVVLIAGFFNEINKRTYFNHFADELLAIGMRPERLHQLWPSSKISVDNYSSQLLLYLHGLCRNDSVPLFMLGHSKGGAEVLASAMKAPEFFVKKITAAFMIQAAVGGSGIADHLAGSGIPMDATMRAAARRLWKLFSPSLRYAANRYYREGFESLTHRTAAALWARLRKEDPNVVNELRDHLFFLSSSAPPRSPWQLPGLTSWYLQSYYGDNDNRLAVEDQILRGVGTSLGHVLGMHDEVVGGINPFLNRYGKSMRRSMARTIATAAAVRAGLCPLDILDP